MQLPDAESLINELASQMRRCITSDTALVGIHTGGVWLAERLHRVLGLQQPLGTIDISFYRDDYSRKGLHPGVKPSSIPFDVAGRSIIIVDDILYTGRTIRAAMNELFDYGRPGRIDLAVLIDRGERELPIAPKFCALCLSAPLQSNQTLQLVRDEEGGFSLRLIDA